jgi:hypothetical protein
MISRRCFLPTFTCEPRRPTTCQPAFWYLPSISFPLIGKVYSPGYNHHTTPFQKTVYQIYLVVTNRGIFHQCPGAGHRLTCPSAPEMILLSPENFVDASLILPTLFFKPLNDIGCPVEWPSTAFFTSSSVGGCWNNRMSRHVDRDSIQPFELAAQLMKSQGWVGGVRLK